MDPSLLSFPGPSQYRQQTFNTGYSAGTGSNGAKPGSTSTSTPAAAGGVLSRASPGSFSSSSGSGSGSGFGSDGADDSLGIGLGYNGGGSSHTYLNANRGGGGGGGGGGIPGGPGAGNGVGTATATTTSSSTPVHPHQPAQSGGSGLFNGPLVEPHQDLNEFLETFWTRQMDGVESEEQDAKGNVSLPLARIKKVMKSDEDVKMISAEVPIMFSKACEIFISELTCRAWLVAESHKRRTLQKSDVAAAIAHSDMFDFLIDIVPRDGEGGDAPANAGEGGGDEEGEGGEGEEGGEGGEGEGEGGGEELYREFVEE